MKKDVLADFCCVYQPTMGKAGINKGHRRFQRNLSPDLCISSEGWRGCLKNDFSVHLLVCAICQKLSQQFHKAIFKMGHCIAQAYHPAEKTSS